MGCTCPLCLYLAHSIPPCDIPVALPGVDCLRACLLALQVAMSTHTVEEVTGMIEQKGNEMELRTVFKEVGFDAWKEQNRLASK